MTLNDRLAMIDNKIANDKAKQEAKQKAEMSALDVAMEKIKDLNIRIWELLEVVNGLKAKGFKIPGDGWGIDADHKALKKYGYDYGAMADGIRHGVGFMGLYSKEPIKYVGFYAGGANGPWDFYTDGAEIFCKHEDSNVIKIPTSYDCQKFLDMFNNFEKAFYAWFEEEMNK